MEQVRKVVVVGAGTMGRGIAQVVAQALDFLCIALADLGAISERRTERLLNPDLSGHPPFLTREPGNLAQNNDAKDFDCR